MTGIASKREASPLTLSLFGPFEVRLHGLPLSRLRSRKGHQLLALLTLRAGREVERSWLAGTLWPDSEEPQALANLRMSLKDLRRALGEAAECLRSPTPRTVSLDLTGAEVDVVALDQAIAQGDTASLERAVGLYRGPLLEGWGEEWIFQERQVREQAFLGALETLAAAAQAAGEAAVAERHLRRAVSVDPFRESAQRSLMQAQAAGGNYAAAGQTFRELRLLLHRELNAEPAPETHALYQRIRAEARSKAALGAGTLTFPLTDIEGSTRPIRSLQLEIAHVLFVDLVEYSRLPMVEQTRQLAQLQRRLRETAEFCRAEASGELICLPTGDGMALVFFRDPVAPVQCAMELARLLASLPEMRLRMGIHTGPVYRVDDINANKNVSGGGINIAERVMDCGDAGHILLSSTAAELLQQLGDWSPSLHDLGDCDVKHGLRLHLFSLHTQELGNPVLPAKLRSGLSTAGSHLTLDHRHGQPGSGPAASPDRRPPGHIALIYKCFAQPDEQVLQLLERELTAHGYPIFIDRHLAVGVEWAKAIEHEVRTADAVVPLLSAASVQSEMLAYELQIAHEAAQHQHGRPRLLPVRVAYTEPVPEPLAGLLDPLRYALWEGPQDDARLVADLVHALRTPSPPTLGVPAGKLEPVGGAVPSDSRFYVVRPTDEAFRAAIARQDSIVLVKGARQIGKTSLLARGLRQAREADARIVRTDLQKLGAADLTSAETLFRTLATSLADQLDLNVLPDEVWNARRSASANFERYVQREVLETIQAPIVWGLDEVDRLFGCDFASDVFGLFRSWHNERAFDVEGPWTRLTLAIAYATEAHLFITDLNQSPFNVGTRLTLDDFTFDQVADLNGRYGFPLQGDAEVARYYRLVNGQPYLVRRGLHEMATRGLEIGALEAQADRDEGIFGDHLRRMLVLLAREPELCAAVREVLRGQPCPTAESFHRLRSAGVLTGESAQDVWPRCQLYRNYLERHLR
jgi:DNA-binding SARP family transcriptional activator